MEKECEAHQDVLSTESVAIEKQLESETGRREYLQDYFLGLHELLAQKSTCKFKCIVHTGLLGKYLTLRRTHNHFILVRTPHDDAAWSSQS